MGVALAGVAILGFTNVSCNSCKRSPPKPGEKPKQHLFSITPADGETIPHLSQPIFVSFRQPVQPPDFKFKIEPDPGGWEVIWDKSQKWVRLEHANPFAPKQQYLIKLSIKEGTFESHFKTLPPDPSELLEADLAQGVITPDEAAQYHIMRIYNPKAVPEKYRYATAPHCGTWDVLQAANLLDRLKPETVKALEPYLVSAKNPKSIYYKRLYGSGPSSSEAAPSLIATAYAAEPAEQVYQTDTGYTIKIYGEPSLARKARDLIEKHKMYEKFYNLFKRETVDFGNKTLCIFIFSFVLEIVDEDGTRKVTGLCKPHSEENTESATTVPEINITGPLMVDDRALARILAHEMLHAFQFAFSRKEQKWLVEGSATWAEDFIGHDWNTEQSWLRYTFDGAYHNPIITKNLDQAYAMYLFFYYLTQVATGGSETIMRQIWENCAKNPKKTFESVRAALPGELSEVLKEYALFTLDVEQYKGRFPDEVGAYGGENPLNLSGYHKIRDFGRINADGTIEIERLVGMCGMGIMYLKVDNEATGVNAPAIKFDLKEFVKNKAIGIQAVIKYRNRQTDKEDWTGREERIFCLAKESENFETLYLVVSRAEETKDIKSLILDIEPASKKECLRREMRITLTVTGQKESEYKKGSPGYDNTSNTNSSWKRQVQFLLKLAPQREEMVPQADAAFRNIPEETREKFLAEYFKPKMDFDENTQCLEYVYRVQSVEVQGLSGTFNESTKEIINDAFGLVSKCEKERGETWTSQGLSAETEEWLKEKGLEVRVFIDPKSNQIKWVNPGPISAKSAITKEFKIDCTKRKGHPPNTRYEPYNYSKPETLNFVWQVQEVSKSVTGLPWNPDWKAKEVSETGARGGGKIERPLDHSQENRGPYEYEKSTTKGLEIKKIEWELKLDLLPAP